MLGGPTVPQLWELIRQLRSIRAIARELGLSRNTVRRKATADPSIPPVGPSVPVPVVHRPGVVGQGRAEASTAGHRP